MNLIAPISAIKSWEGYKYQGNITLYVTLFYIKKILVNHESLDGYEVQIEGEEDFALLKDGKYKSLHQVKSGKVDIDNNDKFAFIAELIQDDAEWGYFHIKPGKSIPNDFFKKARSTILNLMTEYKKKVVSNAELTSSDIKDDYIILEKVTENNKKGTKYSIIIDVNFT